MTQQIWEWVGQRYQRKLLILGGAQAQLYTSIIDSFMNLLWRDDQPSERFWDNALIQTLRPLLSELYLGIVGFFFFPSSRQKKKSAKVTGAFNDWEMFAI